MRYSQCTGCRKIIQKICQTCSTLTRKQFHDQCEKQGQIQNSQGGYVLEMTKKGRESFKRVAYLAQSATICFGVIGFFIFVYEAILDMPKYL